MKALIPFPPLWRLETLAEQPEEKLGESYQIAKDTAITTKLHTWFLLELRDEFISIGVRINVCMDP